MKPRFIIAAVFILILCTVPALAQEKCTEIFKAELEALAGVDTVKERQGNFLTILKKIGRTKQISIVSKVNKLRKANAGQCDFSGTKVAIMDSELEQLKSSSADGLSNKKITRLLYDYVYKLSPVQVEENLRGYEKLAELDPKSSYYKARVEHYQKRVELVKSRAEFINRCLMIFPRNKAIVDLKIKKDFYLFVIRGNTPLKTAEAFITEVAQDTPKPDKKICLIVYSADLKTRYANCPPEYRGLLNSTEEELLMRHVQSLPGYELEQNINGYRALKKINPNSTLYTKKLASYGSRKEGLQRFLNLRTATGSRLISKSSNKGPTLYATVSNEAIDGKSGSANRKLFRLLTDLYAIGGPAYKKCVLKSSSGQTLGTISCRKSGCTFKQ